MSDSSNFDNEGWKDLQSQWQSYQPDIKRLRKKITWVTLRMKLLILASVIIVLGYGTYVFYIYTTESYVVSFALKIWHSVVLLITIYLLYWDIKLRIPLFRIENESSKAIVSLYLKRVKAGIQIGDFGLKVCAGFILLFLCWAGISQYFDLNNGKPLKLGLIVLGLVWIAGFAVGMYWYRNKKRMELLKLERIWKDYID